MTRNKKHKNINNVFQFFLLNPTINSMFLETVKPFQIADTVNKLKPKMSCGHDEIPTKIIKESINSIPIPITHIINRSLLTGRYSYF